MFSKNDHFQETLDYYLTKLLEIRTVTTESAQKGP